MRWSPAGSHASSQAMTGCEKPLRGSSPDGTKGEAASASDQLAHQLGSEDLSALCPIAQALRHHDRGAEVVVRVPDRLADVQADAHAQPIALLAPVVPIDGLLNAYGTCRGVDA